LSWALDEASLNAGPQLSWAEIHVLVCAKLQMQVPMWIGLKCKW